MHYFSLFYFIADKFLADQWQQDSLLLFGCVLLIQAKYASTLQLVHNYDT